MKLSADKNVQCNREEMKKIKIFLTLSLSWIIGIGYLTWVNALRATGPYEGFRWDEWFWFGIIPALAPYLFWFIWKPDETIKSIRCIRSAFSNDKSNKKEG
jgi:hypothetical protein